MKVAEAAELYEQLKPELDEKGKQLQHAKKVLLEHFRRTGRKHYRGRIGYSCSTYQAISVTAVRADLGGKADQYLEERTREQLTLLG